MNSTPERTYYESLWNSEFQRLQGCGSTIPSERISSLLQNFSAKSNTDRALDLGCGNGRHTTLLKQLGYQTIGTDFAYYALKRARQRTSNPLLVQGDACNLPFKKGTFNIIIDSGCLHHVPEEKLSQYEQQVWNALVTGGMLILHQFTKRGELTRAPEQHTTHYFTQEKIKRLFQQWNIQCYEERTAPNGKPYLEMIVRKEE